MGRKTLKAALLGTTLIMAAPAAFAAEVYIQTKPADAWLSTEIVGLNVYNGSGEDAEVIGDVNNLIVGQDGDVDAVVVGVGGFLGMGEKNVAVDYTALSFSTTQDGEQRVVLTTTKEALETAPEFEAKEGEVYRSEQTAMTDTDMMDAASDGETAAIENSDKLPTIDPGKIRTSDLVNKRVYTMDDEWIGEVGDIVLDDKGGVEAVIIDFGGFLGVGEKEVAVGMSTLMFKGDGDSDGDFYVYTDLTKEQLDAAPTYEADSYNAETVLRKDIKG